MTILLAVSALVWRDMKMLSYMYILNVTLCISFCMFVSL